MGKLDRRQSSDSNSTTDGSSSPIEAPPPTSVPNERKILRLLQAFPKNDAPTDSASPQKPLSTKEKRDKKLQELYDAEYEWRCKEIARIFRDARYTGKKLGRPTKLTEEIKRDAMVLARIGVSETSIADSLRVPWSTFCTWIKRNPDFAASLKDAREKGKNILVNSIYGHGRYSWQAHAWLLERMHREQFGQVSRTELTGVKGSEPIVFKVVYEKRTKEPKPEEK